MATCCCPLLSFWGLPATLTIPSSLPHLSSVLFCVLDFHSGRLGLLSVQKHILHTRVGTDLPLGLRGYRLEHNQGLAPTLSGKRYL